MKEITGTYTAVQYEAGTEFQYIVRVPDMGTDANTGLIVFCDGLNEAEAQAAEKLAEEGAMPSCLLVGLVSGVRKPPRPQGVERGMRMKEYDMKGPDYPNFVAEEFLPWLCAEYGLTYSENPDLHMFTGGSSGGCCAWNAVWYRNDFFRRAFLSSPSMLAMGGMDEYLALIRKTEPRPIRCYMTLGENEPDDYFGSSYAVGIMMQRSLAFAGYDFGYTYFPGEGHCCHRDDPVFMEKVYRYLWQNWQTEPVQMHKYNARVSNIVKPDTRWQTTTVTVQDPTAIASEQGTYQIRNNAILFTDTEGRCVTAAEGFTDLTAIAISSDGWRLYAADRTMRHLQVFSIREDGTLCDRDRLCLLHMDSECRHPGAHSICVDNHDRIFAATDLGIQCVRSFGLVDVILPLPGDKPAYGVGYDAERQTLYAESEGTVYFRRLSAETYPIPDEPGMRWQSYYD